MGTVRGQTVLVTGRVDGQLLYVKPSSGPEKSLLVRDLLKAAEDADVNLVVLHSASTPRQPGGRNWLWQKVEVQGPRRGPAARPHGRLPQRAGRTRPAALPWRRTPAGTLRTVLDMRPAPDLPRHPATQAGRRRLRRHRRRR